MQKPKKILVSWKLEGEQWEIQQKFINFMLPNIIYESVVVFLYHLTEINLYLFIYEDPSRHIVPDTIPTVKYPFGQNTTGHSPS